MRLGKVTTRQAKAFMVRLESLVGQSITGAADDETTRWLAGLDDAAHAKLVAVGLASPRTGGRAQLAAFIDAYLDGRSDVKQRTIVNFLQVRRLLVGCFGKPATCARCALPTPRTSAFT